MYFTMTDDVYSQGVAGKCPHCRVTVRFDFPTFVSGYSPNLKVSSGGDVVYVYSSKCPACKKPIVMAHINTDTGEQWKLIHPFGITRPIAPEVPEPIAEDFLEASVVISASEKASAALSRRCLQNLLSDRGYKQRDLSKQIAAAIKDLPTGIANNLDAIRNIGNFAAHPLKHKTTNLVVHVEPEEAEWNLEVLETLFDYYYVQPKLAKLKRDKLDKKLKSIGKPPMKKP